MLAFLPHWLRGSLSFLFIILSTLFWFVPLILLAFVKLLIPIQAVRTVCTRVLIEIATLWIGFNNFLLKVLAGTEWDIEGLEQLNPKDWYLVTCNHQSWADILVVQKVLHRRIPMLKFFLKQQLIWVPVIGVAWWALDFPFMKRYTADQIAKNPSLRGKDLETTRRACEKFRYTPVAVFNFMEGTRFTPEKHAAQQSPYRHLLKPKAGGTGFVLGAMGEQLHTLLNITIHYPCKDIGFWALLSGRLQRVVVRIEALPIPEELRNRNYQEDDAFRLQIQQWVGELWQAKDAQLDQLRAEG
ncbi:1-acyl-sn-glycerol-3-phosphate acyltransferase [Litorivivens lipolytica]|uniref:1-acyl-sn-glycerol-3-phosphate acyltransferase n=1 Tax=Litorivivens lipolytica TaxID=1524264 RepID=A0A7W4W756_9GAMM|nr:1-acyl-sn-glycerol-3-phosphate acyltransferase [Litorivivens lipolytica]